MMPTIQWTPTQFDSERKALDVTLHMMEKQWIPYTDWINFVRKIHLNR